MRIFVSIASYMDDKLERTVEDLYKKAEKPEEIICGICVQDEEEKLEYYRKVFEEESTKERYRVLYVKNTESKGCCWARAKIQGMLRNEEYYMQLDSHHVFVEEWDRKCKEMLENVGEKSIISTYGTPCDMREGGFKVTHEDRAYYMRCEKFYDTHKVRYVPERVNKEEKGGLKRWHTISAHFIFTRRRWVEEVPYDPNLYFDGEEDTLGLRSWTRGWEIYYPTEKMVYHYYIREGEKRHTDYDKEWYKKNERAMKRMKQIIGIEGDSTELGKFGIGTKRTLREYAEETGIDYEKKMIKKKEVVRQQTIPKVEFKESMVIKEEDYELEYEYEKGDITFVKAKDIWNERSKSKGHWCVFKEMKEDEEMYELYDEGRGIWIRIEKDGSCVSYKMEKSEEYKTLYEKGEVNEYIEIEEAYVKNNEKTGIVIISNGNKERNERYCKRNGYSYMHYEGVEKLEWKKLRSVLYEKTVMVVIDKKYQMPKNRIEMICKEMKMKLRENVYTTREDDIAIVHKDKIEEDNGKIEERIKKIF